MLPRYLNFPDRLTADNALVAAGLAKVDKGETTYATSVDVIGGAPKENDYKTGYTSTRTHTGFLVNVMADDLHAELAAYEVHPATPMRVFAGWSPAEVAAREADAP